MGRTGNSGSSNKIGGNGRQERTGTIEGKQQIGRLDVLSLMYGMRITNNWLKMHGGIMARNGGKKKKRRLF